LFLFNQSAKRANKNHFCTPKCKTNHYTKNKSVKCKQCGLIFSKQFSKIAANNFCTHSCSATYNNTHKTHGTRRSKLEKWLEEKLKEKYPQLEIHFNRKDAINSELDIYIPGLKLAFELNGIYHYEPIHGLEKLNSVKNNDKRKFQACLERGIELCIIDTSSFTYFKEDKAKNFLEILELLISNKLSDS
jgi:hypothetical protein